MSGEVEDALLGLGEFGEELLDEMALLACESDPLGLCLLRLCLCEGVDTGRATREDAAAGAGVAVQAKSPVLHPGAQRAIEVLLVLEGASEEHKRGVLEEVLQLVSGETSALAVAACERELLLAALTQQLGGPEEIPPRGGRRACAWGQPVGCLLELGGGRVAVWWWGQKNGVGLLDRDGSRKF